MSSIRRLRLVRRTEEFGSIFDLIKHVVSEGLRLGGTRLQRCPRGQEFGLFKQVIGSPVSRRRIRAGFGFDQFHTTHVIMGVRVFRPARQQFAQDLAGGSAIAVEQIHPSLHHLEIAQADTFRRDGFKGGASSFQVGDGERRLEDQSQALDVARFPTEYAVGRRLGLFVLVQQQLQE